MRKTVRLALSLAAFAVALTPLTTQAEVPGPHPHYLRALSDLRAARGFLSDGFQWGPVRHEDEEAIREIDAAIDEIKRAAIWDGKDLNDHPPIDAHISPHDRFRKANELLGAAHHDLNDAEDVPEARGLRNRAMGHIDHAHDIVDRAWHTAHWE